MEVDYGQMWTFVFTILGIAGVGVSALVWLYFAKVRKPK